MEQSERALRVAQEFSDNSAISASTWNISFAYTQKGDLAQAIQYGEFAVEKAQTPVEKAWAQAYLACAWCRAGELEKGVESLTRFVNMFRDKGYVLHIVFHLPFLGEAYLMADEYDKAIQTVEEFLELAERRRARPYVGWAHRLLGEIALKTKPDEATPHFEQAISIFSEIKAENELGLAYSGMGRYYKQKGNIHQAKEYLTKALEIFERLGDLTHEYSAERPFAGNWFRPRHGDQESL